MRRVWRPHAISVLVSVFCVCLAVSASNVSAQSGSAGMPETAHVGGYGTGWECERGYRATDEDCVAVKVPENGYFIDASHEPGWRCEYGFQAVDEGCVALKLPENAHIDYSGNDWNCNRPYRLQDGRCVFP